MTVLIDASSYPVQTHARIVNRNSLWVPASAAVWALAASGAIAQTSVPTPDLAFMKKAAIGGMVEVELGQLAQQNGSSPNVKEFGTHMAEDHSKANDELKQLAASKGVTLPAGLDAKNQKVVDRLKKLSGAAFDRAYMTDMVADHKEDIAEFSKESRGGKDTEVKAFAAKTLPTLQGHLEMAKSTAAAARGSASKSASGAGQ